MKNITKDKFSINDSLAFIIPSLIGILLFMIPIKFNGEITIPIISGKLIRRLFNSYYYTNSLYICNIKYNCKSV